MLVLLWPHGLQQARLPRLPLSPGVCSSSCPLCLWCYLAISPSATLFTFWHSQHHSHESALHIGGQSTETSASASVLPMNIEGWFPLGLTGLISLLSKGLSKSLLQHHNLKASILQHSVFFMIQLSHLYMTTGKTIALIIQIFVSKVMSLLFSMLPGFVIAFFS